MGFSIAWFAVRSDRADGALAELALARTGSFEDIPRSAVSTVALKSGWQLVWCNDYDSALVAPDVLARLSIARDVLVCRAEEHVMASSSEFWSGGERRWAIAHEGENGPVGLEIHGQPPASCAGIREEMERAQVDAGGRNADVDHLFEVPLLVARDLVGFKHDEDYEATIDGRFEVLSAPRDAAKRKGLMSRLFG